MHGTEHLLKESEAICIDAPYVMLRQGRVTMAL